MRTILLGPQRFTLKATTALRSLGTEGPAAVINAGWEEREDDLAELDAALDGRARNLRLFHRLGDVLAKDHRFASAATVFRNRHDELTRLYRLRLDHSKAEVYAVQRHLPRPAETATPRPASGAADVPAGSGGGPVDPAPPDSVARRAFLDAIDNVRRTDAWYLRELDALYAALRDEGGTESSGVIGWHRGEIVAAQSSCAAMVLPGGNVRTLMSALRLFRVEIPDDLPVVAWSAGAMALTDRVVLFHDHGLDGSRETEVFDHGLGRIRRVVLFPHARRRLRMTDPARLTVLAHRFLEAECVVLDDGTLLDVSDGARPASARIIRTDGHVHTGAELGAHATAGTAARGAANTAGAQPHTDAATGETGPGR